MKKQPLNEEFRRMQKLAGLITESGLKEYDDLSIKNNYITPDDDEELPSKWTDDINRGYLDIEQLESDLIKAIPYFKSLLPLRDDKPLDNNYIIALIKGFVENLYEDFDAGYMDPSYDSSRKLNYKSMDIDDLTNDFISYVNGVTESGSDWDLADDMFETYQ
jgi:hypothetical protein